MYSTYNNPSARNYKPYESDDIDVYHKRKYYNRLIEQQAQILVKCFLII